MVPPKLMSSALFPRDFLPEIGEDGAGAACEELPELHCVSAGTAGLAPAFPLSHAVLQQQQSCSDQHPKSSGGDRGGELDGRAEL